LHRGRAAYTELLRTGIVIAVSQSLDEPATKRRVTVGRGDLIPKILLFNFFVSAQRIVGRENNENPLFL
jgi:hypothetical protein